MVGIHDIYWVNGWHKYVKQEGGWVPSNRDKTWRGGLVDWADHDVTPTI